MLYKQQIVLKILRSMQNSMSPEHLYHLCIICDIFIATSGFTVIVMLILFICRCAYHGGSFGRGQTKMLQCSQPRVGRFVFVKLRVNEYLTLCEVEVLGVKCMFLYITCFLFYNNRGLNRLFCLCQYEPSVLSFL